MNHPNNWGDKDGFEKIILTGSGTLKLEPPSDFSFYKREIQPCHSMTLEVGSNCWSQLTYIRQWNSSTIRLLADWTVGYFLCSETGCKIDLNGHNLYVGCSEHAYGAVMAYKGQVVGKGRVTYYGGEDFSWSSASTYTGELALYTGRFFWEGSDKFPTTVFPIVNGPNRMIFNAGQTLARISGDGVAGGIQMPDVADATLTLTGTGGVRETTTYNARLFGKDVVKRGADYDLRLSGDNAYTGSTTVAEGTLSLWRPYCRPGLVACWTFDDPDDLGRDYGPSGSHLTMSAFSTGVVTQRLDGVGGGGALGLGTTNAQNWVGCGRAEVTGRTRFHGFPCGNDPLSVTMWVKPKPGNSTTAYLFRLGNWGSDGGQFVLWQRGEEKMEWLIDNWITTDGPTSPVFNCPGLSDGGWHQIAATYQDQQIKIYYDGQLVRETTTTHKLAMGSSYTVSIGNNDGQPNNTGGNHYYHGGVDDVCVWNRALSAEEIADEYTCRHVAVDDPAAKLPAPVCHWSFNDASNPGKDEMGHADLIANPNRAYTPATESFAGCFGRNLMSGSTMILPPENFPTNFPQGNVPFTVSIRFLPGTVAERVDVLRWGGETDVTTGNADYFRLWYLLCPRRLHVTCGNIGPSNSRQAFSWSNNYTTRLGAWTHAVVTVDPLRSVMRIYRDGRLETTRYDLKGVDLAAGKFCLNANPASASTTGVRIDDVRIYDTAFSAEEVKTLTRSLETGTVGPVLPASSAVTVAAGAYLKAEGEQHRVKSIAGSGGVKIIGSLLADDWSGFTGTVDGFGSLVVKNGATGPLNATVSTRITFENDVVALSSAQLQTPLARTSATVCIPTNATLRLVDANGRAAKWAGQCFKIAECTSYEGPADTRGLTFEPDDPALNLEGTFSLVDGTLYLRMKGAGTMILFR